MSKALSFVVGLALAMAAANFAVAQGTTAQPPIPPPVAPPEYGAPIKLELAHKIVEAAEVEAKKQGWPVAIAIVDSSGFLVLFHRLDNTQLASVEISIEKAKTAAHFRRPTKAFEEVLEKGGANVKVLRIPGLPIEGGVPIMVDGKIVGAIGVSGVKSNEDGLVAAAGLTAVK
ncbi:hypothetical protein ETAA8_50430 [Anatilimnocola aggregata]|uniref:Heme-binding protein n=1 Tax=Anatilimnocola aggregata TaxID=2528021 RepID=A0A517YI76_9BACT|nr:heme-binding protein [Anatilimnocola aggregata]QDU29926.1 hypothetical protein ETAA8_50430 [Anatilimnocola aggregata]